MATAEDICGISDEVIRVYTFIVFGVVCQAINVFGIVTNIINIICLSKQGFQDTINITLTGLSISDLGSLVTMVLTCIFLSISVTAADLSFDPLGVSYLTSAMTHLSFTRISGCITAMITMERCLCITAPLKVKSMITPKRATVVVTLVSVTLFCSGIPLYAVYSLDMAFSYLSNKTILSLVATEYRQQAEMISFGINNFSIPCCAFVIIVVCTTILTYKLRKNTKWRNTMVAHTSDDRISSRNKKAAKMVVVISVLFIVCFVPICSSMLALASVPEMTPGGHCIGISVLIGGLGYTLESINESMNIFIYYSMSSKYRGVLRTYFSRYTARRHLDN